MASHSVFDGYTLTLYNSNGVVVDAWQAMSGNNGFQKPSEQNLSFKGPLTEGTYSFSTNDIQPLTAFDVATSVLSPLSNALLGTQAFGKFPGAMFAWGTERVALNPDPLSSGDRGNFFIHGGVTVGSAGCIDLGPNEQAYFDAVRSLGGGSNTVTVSYNPNLETSSHPLEGSYFWSGASDYLTRTIPGILDRYFPSGTQLSQNGDSLSITYPDGAKTIVEANRDFSAEWSSKLSAIDAQNHVVALETVAVDRSAQLVASDVNENQLWSLETIKFDPQNRIIDTTTNNDDGGRVETVFDTGAQPWSSQTSAFDSYERLQSQRVVLDGGSQQVKQYDPNNTHPYTELDIDEDATGKITSAQMKLDGQNQSTPADFSAVGQVLGSALGRALAPNNQFVQLAAGTVAGAAGQKLAQAFAASLSANGSTIDLTSVFSGFDVSIAGAGASSVASFLIAEFGTALHLDGFGAQLFDAGAGGFAGSVASQIATEMARGASFDLAIGAVNFGNAAVSAGYSISSLLGTYLAHELVPAQTHAGAVAGSLLGAVGSTVGISIALSNVLGEILGGVLNFIVPGLGSLIGTIVGTLLGDALAGDPGYPKAAHDVEILGSDYYFQNRLVGTDDHGNAAISQAMGDQVAAIANSYLKAVSGEAIAYSGHLMIGYNSGAAPYSYVAGWFPNGTESAAHFASADDAVQEGVRELLVNTEAIGGDLLLKRAHRDFILGTHPDPNTDPNDFTDLIRLSADLSVAQDYENYLNNKEVINALIAANPNSAFAAGWIATFARVNDLGLNHVGPSDFLGGLVGYLDSVKKAGLGFDAAGVSVSHGGDGSVTVGIRVPDGTEVPGALSAFANQTTQSSDAGGTTVKLVFTNALADVGFHLVSPGASAGDAGNDLWFGNPNASNIYDGTASANAILVGGAQNDVISSGNGWDFLDGGDGNDALYSGGGNDILRGGPRGDLLVGGAGNDTYVFNRGDGPDVVIDDYRSLQWVSDNPGSLGSTGSYRQVQADAGRDTLAFGPGIAVSDITIVLAGGTLTVTVKDPANPDALDRIAMQDWTNPMNRIETFVFADGTTLDLSAGNAALAARESPFGASLSHSAVAENATAGTAVGTVHGFDLNPGAVLSYTLLDSAGGRFAVNAATGVVTVANGAALDYETAHAHQITVRTADQNGKVFDQAFTVAVTDVAEKHAPVSDFDGDGKSDTLWYRDNGAVGLWNGGQAVTAHNIGGPGTASNGWHIAGQGDFDGNGKSDILWLNDNGAMMMWDNGQLAGAHLTVNPGGALASQHIEGIGDFDGNGKSDILWRNDAGGVFIWDNGTGDGGHVLATAGVVAAGWNIAGVGDFDGNGKSDILWLNDNGAMMMWDNGQLAGAHLTVNPGGALASQHIEGIGDFDGNGKSDILWRNDAGGVFIWDNGTGDGGHTVAVAGVVAAGWNIAGVGDFDGNGKSDILWRHDNGTLSDWDNGQLAGAHITAYPGSFTLDWHIV